jgi:hypothetical protein
MSLKITFINPNSSDDVDKYLPKILAEAVLNRITQESLELAAGKKMEYNVKHSA